MLPTVLVVVNQCYLVMCRSDLRNFSAFEVNVCRALIRQVAVRKGEWLDSGSFQSFAEKVRKIRVLEEVNIYASGLKFIDPEVFRGGI